MPASLISSSEGCVVCWWALRQAGGRAGRPKGGSCRGRRAPHMDDECSFIFTTSRCLLPHLSELHDVWVHQDAMVQYFPFDVLVHLRPQASIVRHLFCCGVPAHCSFQMNVSTAIHACRLELHDAVPG